VSCDEIEAVAVGLLVDEVVDAALAIDGDLFGAMACDFRKTHQLEQRMQFVGLGMSVLDELKAVGAHRIVGADHGRRRVMGERTHCEFSLDRSV